MRVFSGSGDCPARPQRLAVRGNFTKQLTEPDLKAQSPPYCPTLRVISLLRDITSKMDHYHKRQMIPHQERMSPLIKLLAPATNSTMATALCGWAQSVAPCNFPGLPNAAA
jgi:hypothetical protein